MGFAPTAADVSFWWPRAARPASGSERLEHPAFGPNIVSRTASAGVPCALHGALRWAVGGLVWVRGRAVARVCAAVSPREVFLCTRPHTSGLFACVLSWVQILCDPTPATSPQERENLYSTLPQPASLSRAPEPTRKKYTTANTDRAPKGHNGAARGGPPDGACAPAAPRVKWLGNRVAAGPLARRGACHGAASHAAPLRPRSSVTRAV